MATINPYFNFPGNTEEAFKFYQSVFGGEFAGGINRFRDTPEADKVPDEEKDKIMHIALPIGKNTLMATDALESMGQSVNFGNNIHLSVHTDSKEEADDLFGKLSDGGSVTMPMEDAFWGDYFGMVTDRFGIHWMMIYSNQRG